MSATMLCAHRAGIAVFATGGVGGVHRGAEESEPYMQSFYNAKLIGRVDYNPMY